MESNKKKKKRKENGARLWLALYSCIESDSIFSQVTWYLGLLFAFAEFKKKSPCNSN